MEARLRRVYWETTAGCNLRCLHCRRVDALTKADPGELSTAEAKAMMDDLSEMGRPTLILSGGEPLLRRDIYELAAYAKGRGMGVGLATNGTLVDSRIAHALRDAGVHYASVSLDGARPKTHDAIRGRGNFAKAMRGILWLKEAGIKVQINFTVSRKNVGELEEIYRTADALHVAALYLFLLVPVGCGAKLDPSAALSAPEVEDWLRWVLQKQTVSGGPALRAICAPHYYRLKNAVLNGAAANAEERQGCLAGIHMAFISHKGEVFPCGYLPLSCGNVREKKIRDIWAYSEVLQDLREPDLLKGACGSCAYSVVCGGCRARASAAFGDYLREDPACVPAVAGTT